MDHVLVDLPFVHRIEGRRLRKRADETFVAVATVPARIRIAGWGEGEKFAVFRRGAEDSKVEGVVVDGVAHVYVEDRTGGVLGRDIGDARFFADWARNGVDRVPLDMRRTVLRAIHGGPRDRSRIGRLADLPELSVVTGSDEREGAAEAARTAEGLIYHAGRLASSHLEPAVCFEEDARVGVRANDVRAVDVRDPVSAGSVFAMDSLVGPMENAVKGVPDGCRSWRMADVENMVVRAWDTVVWAFPGSSTADIREDASLLRRFASGARAGRLPPEEIADACDAVERAARSRIRSAQGFGIRLDVAMSTIDTARSLVAARRLGPEFGATTGDRGDVGVTEYASPR